MVVVGSIEQRNVDHHPKADLKCWAIRSSTLRPLPATKTDPNLNNNATTEPEVVCLALTASITWLEVSSNEFDADAENNVSSACTVASCLLLETGDNVVTGSAGRNGDGIQDAGEDGIANVVVTLTRRQTSTWATASASPSRRRRVPTALHLHRPAAERDIHGDHCRTGGDGTDIRRRRRTIRRRTTRQSSRCSRVKNT